MSPRALPVGLLLLVASGALILRPLAHFWSGNEEYAYGWGVPLLAAYLFYERWRCRPESSPPRTTGAISLGWILTTWAVIFFGLRLVIETEPASRPLLWVGGCLFTGALLAWMGLLGGRPWLRHFAFPILFLLVGVPWIFGCEFWVVQNLMRLNATWVAHSLALLAIPARAAGNTIVLPNGQLGVSAACSGIRSLQAALMMALFFGEFYRFGWRGRWGLVGSGIALALLGNFARMFYLAACGAMDGLAEVEAEHDSTGWFILLFTIIGLWLICMGTRQPMLPVRKRLLNLTPNALGGSLAWALGIFAATVFAEAATQGWYGWRESSAPHYPAWTVTWPESAPDFQSAGLSPEIRRQLHASEGNQAAWRDLAGRRWAGLWIRYRGNAEGKVVFESHNPSLCLPAAGWRALPGIHAFALEVNGLRLDIQAESFALQQGTAHVFWVPYLDGGVRAGADQGHGLYGHTLGALLAGRFPWMADVWAGCRRVDAESLEVSVMESTNYADAEAAFRRVVPRLVRAEPLPSPTLVAGAH